MIYWYKTQNHFSSILLKASQASKRGARIAAEVMIVKWYESVHNHRISKESNTFCDSASSRRSITDLPFAQHSVVNIPICDQVWNYALNFSTQLNSTQTDKIWPKFDTTRHKLTQTVTFWPNLTQADINWHNQTQSDTIWHNLTQSNTNWHILIKPETLQKPKVGLKNPFYIMARKGTKYHSVLIANHISRFGKERSKPELVG